jgi:hypothetical protein
MSLKYINYYITYSFFFQNFFIIGRVVSINGIYIPHNRSKPFIVAFYHGCTNKPNLEAFLSDFLKELIHLDPNRPVGENELMRSLTVRTRAIVADAPARAWLKCVKGHMGYYACERCHIRGGILHVPQRAQGAADGDIVATTRKGMKFATMDDAMRSDDKWHTYWTDPEPLGQVAGCHLRHRTAITPLDRIPHLVKPISGFPLEEMHLVDGGALKDAIKMLLKLPKNWSTVVRQNRKKPKLVVNKITNAIQYAIKIPSARAILKPKKKPIQLVEQQRRWKKIILLF